MSNGQSNAGKEAEKAGAKAEEIAGKAAGAAEAHAESLRAEISELRRDLEELVAQVAKVGRAGVEDAKRTAQAKVHEGREAGEHLAEEMAARWDELDRRITAETRDNPWRALGIAAVAGLVVGLILRR